MLSFSKKSTAKLRTCDIKLQELFETVVKSIDCTVICGYRSNEDQDKAFNEKKSKLKAGQSKHNLKPSLAIDVAPYPLEWDDIKRFYYLAGYVKATAEKLGIEIIWGGDWDSDNDFSDQTFNDLCHYELKNED